MLANESAQVRTILLVRALPGLGDLLCAAPAIRTLRAALPKAHLVLLGLPQSQAMLQWLPGMVDEFLSFSGFPGIPESPSGDSRAMLCGLSLLQQRHFDLVVQLHGDGRTSNAFAALAGGRHTAGTVLDGEWSPDPALYVKAEPSLPEPERALRVVERLGARARILDPGWTCTLEDVQGADAVRRRYGLAKGRYVCIHPGASTPERRWPVWSFAQTADHLADSGFGVVVTGTAEEGHLAVAMARHMRHDLVDLTGKSDLGVLSALLRAARLIVANDTGVSHLAAAVAAPSVIVFTGSDPGRWAPLDRRRHRPVGAGVAASTPTVKEVCEQVDVLLAQP